MCPTEPFVQLHRKAFRGGDMLIAVDTAFRRFMQSCDLAVVGAKAK
jgi:hypothetical protein